MTDQPVTPTRIIPAGEPLPAPPMPYAPHDAVDLPPWRTPAPPPRAAAPPPPVDPPIRTAPADPDPAPLAVRVTVDLVHPQPKDEPGRWERLWNGLTSRVQPWKAVLALLTAVLPIPWTGYSAATTWAYTTSEARGLGAGFAYALAAGAFLLAVRRLTRRPGLLPLWATAVTAIGLFGAADWFDLITWLTGVSR